MKPLAVYDWNTKKRLAYLENAYDVQYSQQINTVWSAEFKLPYGDEKKAYCLPRNLVEIWDVDAGGDDKYVGLFKIMPVVAESNESTYEITFTLEHVFGSLIDSSVIGYRILGGEDGETSREIFEALLAYQYLEDYENPWGWVLNECPEELIKPEAVSDIEGEEVEDVKYPYEFEDISILEAIYAVLDGYDNYYPTFNTQVFPWELNILPVSTTPISEIRYGKNIFGITKKIDPTNLCTRLYIYGAQQEDGTKLTISSITGTEYIDSPNAIEQYGRIVMIINDSDFTTPEALYLYGVIMLSKMHIPLISYEIQIETVWDTANLNIADTVRLIAEDGFEDILIVQEISKDDLFGAPNKGKVTIGQGTIDIGVIMKRFI